MNAIDNGVLEAARAIRPYLPELVGPDIAAELDPRLADQLADTSDWPGSARRLRWLLEYYEETSWFLAEVLTDAPHHRPPYLQPRYLRSDRDTRGTAPPMGDPWPIAADRYICPKLGDYVWYRPDIGTPIRDCPSCHVLLIRT